MTRVAGVGAGLLTAPAHPAAAPLESVMPIEEGHLALTLGVMARQEAMPSASLGMRSASDRG